MKKSLSEFFVTGRDGYILYRCKTLGAAKAWVNKRVQQRPDEAYVYLVLTAVARLDLKIERVWS